MPSAENTDPALVSVGIYGPLPREFMVLRDARDEGDGVIDGEDVVRV
jgi:hypothetical protein